LVARALQSAESFPVVEHLAVVYAFLVSATAFLAAATAALSSASVGLAVFLAAALVFAAFLSAAALAAAAFSAAVHFLILAGSLSSAVPLVTHVDS